MKHVIAHNTSPDRVFNMDETGLSQKSRQTKVVVGEHLRGQGIEELVEQVCSVQLPFLDRCVRVSGGLCLLIAVHFTRLALIRDVLD